MEAAPRFACGPLANRDNSPERPTHRYLGWRRMVSQSRAFDIPKAEASEVPETVEVHGFACSYLPYELPFDRGETTLPLSPKEP